MIHSEVASSGCLFASALELDLVLLQLQLAVELLLAVQLYLLRRCTVLCPELQLSSH